MIFCCICLVRSYLIINLVNKSFKTSVELANKKLFLALDDRHPYRERVNFPYMETLAFV